MASKSVSVLDNRVREFLSTVRVGVDFGEHTGGIAVVRGNEILHAETYLDFHEATLEQRRILRRGRRSRHAKKMRLARLRSWVLRQRLPDSSRLPDPYEVMRNPKYMVQPGVFKEEGTSPHAAPHWIKLAKEGRADSHGFVRALTLLFQKRGYKWDAIGLEEMTDAKLKDFLHTARIPTGDPALANQVREQIERRHRDPNDPIRGKAKVSPDELLRLLDRACQRGNEPPRPRLAEHRSVKEADLRGVVEGFERSAGLPNEISERWKKELCRLLNKVLRPARFQNRLKTGCAWCGKSTPRKARVRELAYKAAVNNLRARERFRTRPLSDAERREFLAWWANPETAPGADSIKKRIIRLNPEQKGMARQFHDLLKNPEPKGRASLCIEHLEMAAAGKTMKDAGVDWQTVAVRKAPNPCRERRDARVLHRLEQILFKPGPKGAAAWRFGPVSFLSLEIPDPDTLQLGKGQQAKRQGQPLKDRLAEETDGCIYKCLGNCGGPIDKDHIYPRSKGGPDLQVNLVAACMEHNKEKHDRTPFQWLGGDRARWALFEKQVLGLPISERKKKILLNPSEDYPEGDPTPFARVGARPRQFVVALGKIFEKYGVTPARSDYELGRPLVQRIRGSETHRFRLSWCKKEDGSDNFPYPKDRSSLFNHAEDAALLAAAPPHTWRDLVFCHTADRPTLEGSWKPRPGLALPHLAPDWARFVQSRETPLVRILGRYPVTWKSQFADLTFWREPQKDTPRLIRFKLLRDIQRKDFKNIVSRAMRSRLEDIAADVGLGEKGTIAEAVARQIAGKDAKPSAVREELPRAIEQLEKQYPHLRRLQVSSQKGGTLVQVPPADGPVRKVQIKPASEGIILWRKLEGKRAKKSKLRISLVRPRPLQQFGLPRVDPRIPPDAEILGQLSRHAIMWLAGLPDRPEGYFRVTKCQENGVTLMPEEEVPAEIARRSGTEAAREGPSEEAPGRFVLGRQELADYFATRRAENADRP